MASRVREGPCWGEAFAAVDDVRFTPGPRYTWTTFHRDHLWHRRFSPFEAMRASFCVPQCHVHYTDASALPRTPVSTSFVSRFDSTCRPTLRVPNFPRVIRTLSYGIVIDFLNAKVPLSMVSEARFRIILPNLLKGECKKLQLQKWRLLIFQVTGSDIKESFQLARW